MGENFNTGSVRLESLKQAEHFDYLVVDGRVTQGEHKVFP